MGGGKLEGKDLWNPQEMKAGEQGRLPWAFCCRTGYEPGGLDLDEKRERARSSVNLADLLEGVACGLADCVCWNWGLGYSDEWGGGSLEGVLGFLLL